jgi:HlyB family type I secretion system ABC transporter
MNASRDFNAEEDAGAAGAAEDAAPARAVAQGGGRRPSDGLLACLLRLSREFGRPVTAAEVRAMVPLSPGGMTPDQFCRAAQRLGWRVERRPLDGRPPRRLAAPALLVGRASAKLLLLRGKGLAEVYDPDSDRVEAIEEARALSGMEEAISVQSGGARAAGEPWRRQLSRRVRGVLGELIAASLVINILALATPLFAMTVFNKVIGQQALDTLQVLAFGMAAVYVFDALLRILRGYVSSHTGARVDALIGSEVMHHLLHLPFRHFETTPAGLIGERVRQLDTIRTFFTGQMPMVIVDLAFVVVFLVVLVFLHPLLALITVAAVPVFVGLSFAFHRRQAQLVEQAFAANAAKSSQLGEAVQNALTVKGLGLEAEVERRWDQRLALAAWTGFRANHLNNTVAALGHALTLAVSLLILSIGALQVIEGEMTIGALIAANILATRALAPLRLLVGAWTQVQEVRKAFERIDDIMKEPTEAAPGEVGPAQRLDGKVVFENLGFAFEEGRAAALEGVDLTVPAGTIMGVIGPSGSGKTTLMRLLQGLYAPQSGRVLLDDTDIAHLSSAAVRQQLGVVPQEVQLFAGTVRENIQMGSGHNDPERVVAVAKFVGAHDFIQRLPQGYDTPLAERGVGLSAGQRQMLAIARALIRNPRILILDEATSDLDPASEEQFLRALKRASRGRTVIVVSHRLAPLSIADRVALLIDGRVERVGPPSEVIAFAKARMAERSQGRATSGGMTSSPSRSS